MKHCTICGEECENGEMMRVHKGPKQYVCPACGEEQKANQMIGLVIFIIAMMVMVFVAAAH